MRVLLGVKVDTDDRGNSIERKTACLIPIDRDEEIWLEEMGFTADGAIRTIHRSDNPVGNDGVKFLLEIVEPKPKKKRGKFIGIGEKNIQASPQPEKAGIQTPAPGTWVPVSKPEPKVEGGGWVPVGNSAAKATDR